MKKTLPVIQAKTLCDSCRGGCCQHMGYPPFVGALLPDDSKDRDDEWDELPFALKGPILRAVHACRGDNEWPCIWLDQGVKCRHYQHRPRICREFEVGGESCMGYREEFATELGA